jgi:hypothetical protein
MMCVTRFISDKTVRVSAGSGVTAKIRMDRLNSNVRRCHARTSLCVHKRGHRSE